MTTTECYGCEDEIHIQEDQWWQYQWEENPSKEEVEQAIDKGEHRDWFKENKVFCSNCHHRVQNAIRKLPAQGVELNDA